MEVYEDSGGVYGRRKMHAAFARRNIKVAKCTVERWRRELGYVAWARKVPAQHDTRTRD